MEVVTLLLFVGAVWVIGMVGLFAWNLRTHGHEHADRLALLPLEGNWTDPGVPHALPSQSSLKPKKVETP